MLTELGERILPQIDLIINAAQDITGCGAELRNQLAGEVKVAVAPQIAPYLAGPLFSKLKQQHPLIRLSVWEAFGGTKADLRDGKTDIAVYMHTDSSMGEDDRVVGELESYLIGLPDSPATRDETIAFSQLSRLPLLLPSLPNSWRRLIDQIAANKGMSINVAAEVNSPGPTAALVQAGAGYLLSPLASGAAAARMGWIGADVRAGRLRASRVVDPGFTFKLVVSASPHRRRPADAVARLIDSMLADLMNPDIDDDETERAAA